MSARIAVKEVVTFTGRLALGHVAVTMSSLCVIIIKLNLDKAMATEAGLATRRPRKMLNILKQVSIFGL